MIWAYTLTSFFNVMNDISTFGLMFTEQSHFLYHLSIATYCLLADVIGHLLKRFPFTLAAFR